MEFKVATIWFTGLSASGKSTLSERLHLDLENLGISNIKYLDGEAIRERFGNFNFDDSSREEIGNKKIELAIEENQKGNIVIITGIAHQKKWRESARVSIENYFEIYLNATPEVCAKRDYKDHYRRAFNGEIENFIGVTESYEEDLSAVDLIVNSGADSVENCSKLILKEVIKYLRAQ